MLRSIAFLLAVLAAPGALADLYEICWDLPTLDVNGNPVEGLGVRVYSGDDEIANVGWVSCAQVELLVGTHEISVAAYNSEGEAARSPTTQQLVEPPPPPPRGVPTAMEAPTLSFLMVGGGGDAATPGPVVAGYSLASIGTIPFAYNPPAPPTSTSQTINVPADMSLTAALAVNNAVINVADGSYGQVLPGGQDQEIILGNVTFSELRFLSSARRIIVRSAVPRLNEIGYLVVTTGEDILLDGLSNNVGTNRNFIGATRSAIINSYFRTIDFALCAFDASYSDVIVANTVMEAYGSTQAGTRFQGISRFIFVDNRVEKTGSDHNAFRLHGNNNLMEWVYVARNQIEGPRMIIAAGGGSDPSTARWTSAYFEDNYLYMTPGGSYGMETAANFSQAQDIDNLTFINNQAYGVSSTWLHPGTGSWTNKVESGNTVSDYVSPPSWSYR